MSDVDVKPEIIRDEDSDSGDVSFPDLAELLNDVKKEEFIVDNPQASQVQDTEQITESFFDDLLREELEANSPGSSSDADIASLEKLLEEKKRILNDENSAQSTSVRNRKRKDQHETNVVEANTEEHNGTQAKRSRKVVDQQSDKSLDQNSHRNSNVLSKTQTPPSSDTANQTSTSANCPQIENEQALPSELELENLLKTDDYHSDDETTNHSQGTALSNNMQPLYGYPNVMPMVPPVYDPTTNQMIGNVPPGGFPLMYNMGLQPGFYPPNMLNMQMMNYGLPPVSFPANNDEVQCLPVINETGCSGIPIFKRIKLEIKKDALSGEKEKEAASAEERRRKIFERCTTLLKQMEFPEPTGKFIHTPTVTKLNSDVVSNSVLQKISNVSYDYHSIGPKLNMQNWALKEIPYNNAEIAKKIGMSADRYFTKIKETANTIARKLIKVEEDKAKAIACQEETAMEVEEPTLSSFLKNTMTQTDDLVCKECVARKRKVGHDIAVQASVGSGSIDTQTDPMMNPSEQITAGLNENQMRALYDFSNLIREPAKKTTEELLKLRENLIVVYNLSQRQYRGPVPNLPAFEHSEYSAAGVGTTGQQVRDPRFDNRWSSDPRGYSTSGTQVESPKQNYSNYQAHAIPVLEMTRKNYQPPVSPAAEASRQNLSNYQPQLSPIPRNRNPDPPEYTQNSLRENTTRMQNHQQSTSLSDRHGQSRPGAQFQGQNGLPLQASRDSRQACNQRPVFRGRGYPTDSQQDGGTRKGYGRGGF